MNINEKLRLLNPWWKSPNEIEKDESIQQWKSSPLKYDPRIRFTFDYNSDIVYSLRGPRQVGKTTLVKLQIRDFLSRGVSPWNILYFSCDLEKSPQDVVDVIRGYLALTRIQRAESRIYLFLDEITSVKDWQRGIKWLWDRGTLKNCTVVATGSHSMDIKQSTERLPGRRGTSNDSLDKIMLPMKFAEYVYILNHKLGEVLGLNFHLAAPRLEILSQLAQGKLDKRLKDLYGYVGELNEILYEYMLTGGIPRVVNEYVAKKKLEEGTYTTYLESILGQLSSLNKEETIVKQLIGQVINNLSWPVSWRTLQRDTDVGSVNTAINYLTTLRDMFVLTISYQYGEVKKVPRIDKEKRIRFHDPFFLHVMNGWLSAKPSFELSESFREDPANQGMLVEGIVCDHLIRLAFRLSRKKQTFDYANYVFNWRYEGSGELDYVLYDGSELELPIEVKFGNKISKKIDLKGISRFQKVTGVRNGLLLTKDQMETTSDYVMLPASMFLLLA